MNAVRRLRIAAVVSLLCGVGSCATSFHDSDFSYLTFPAAGVCWVAALLLLAGSSVRAHRRTGSPWRVPERIAVGLALAAAAVLGVGTLLVSPFLIELGRSPPARFDRACHATAGRSTHEALRSLGFNRPDGGAGAWITLTALDGGSSLCVRRMFTNVAPDMIGADCVLVLDADGGRVAVATTGYNPSCR